MTEPVDHSADYEARDALREWLAMVKPATPRVVWWRCRRADWMLLLLDCWCTDAQLETLRPQLRLAAVAIAENAVIVHTHCCGIPEIEAWGAHWLIGADRTRAASQAAKAAVPFNEAAGDNAYAVHSAIQAAECAQSNYLGSTRNGVLPQLRSVSHDAWSAAILGARGGTYRFNSVAALSWQAKCLHLSIPRWPSDARVRCVGSGDENAGCGWVSGLPGGMCSQCGGMLLSSRGLEDAKRLQAAWERQQA